MTTAAVQRVASLRARSVSILRYHATAVDDGTETLVHWLPDARRDCRTTAAACAALEYAACHAHGIVYVAVSMSDSSPLLAITMRSTLLF